MQLALALLLAVLLSLQRVVEQLLLAAVVRQLWQSTLQALLLAEQQLQFLVDLLLLAGQLQPTAALLAEQLRSTGERLQAEQLPPPELLLRLLQLLLLPLLLAAWKLLAALQLAAEQRLAAEQLQLVEQLPLARQLRQLLLQDQLMPAEQLLLPELLLLPLLLLTDPLKQPKQEEQLLLAVGQLVVAEQVRLV